jgi:hypothetical protein
MAIGPLVAMEVLCYSHKTTFQGAFEIANETVHPSRFCSVAMDFRSAFDRQRK